MLEQLLRESFTLVILFSALPLGVASLVGVFVGFIQTSMQVQEQSLLYLLKFGTISLLLAVCGRWYATQLVELTVRNINLIVSIGKI